ncbi:MAG: NnrS family protein [Robiginitomaculum sp.]|nr:NnrS family protein [Robiginitomaculum sp.]
MKKANPTPSVLKKTTKASDKYKASAFLSQGFRPFFLGAGIWALIAIPMMMADFFGYQSIFLQTDSIWHAHEMLFGFAAAAIAGFLLTAIPNWTGRLPVQGTPLSLLVILWLSGRTAMLLQPVIGMYLASITDSLFLIVFTAIIFREVIAGKNWRNLKIVMIVAAMALANIWFHLEILRIVANDGIAIRAAISLIVLLIALIGGRIIPSFTRNTLKKRGSTSLPTPTNNFDRIVLTLTLVTGSGFTLAPTSLLTAMLASLCVIMHFIRLIRWRGLQVLFEPMLWILHLSYLWIVIGFALLAISYFFPLIPQSAAIHAFTIGAFASMIIAVITRASRGHTGRSLTADKWTTIIYLSISLAAFTRVAGAIFGEIIYHQIASGFWALAFGVFVICYWPVLTGKDARARP